MKRGHRSRNHLMLLVYRDVQFSPDAAFFQAMLGFLPLAGTVHLLPRSVRDDLAAGLDALGKSDDLQSFRTVRQGRGLAW